MFLCGLNSKSTENQEKLLKKLEKEGEDMISEVLRKENEKQRREGRKEGIKETIIQITQKMLEKNMNTKDIQEITGVSQKELQNLVKTNN